MKAKTREKRKRPYVRIKILADGSSIREVIFSRTPPTLNVDIKTEGPEGEYCMGPFHTNDAAEFYKGSKPGQYVTVAAAEKAFAKAFSKL